MSLSLTCRCGAAFEVAETFGGQDVSCPECQQAVPVPTRQRQPLRTSGYAVASVLCALIGAFTVIGTLLAVLLGLAALVSISRNRKAVTGTGFAAFGIVVGAVFTGLAVFAYSKGELFGVDERLREQMLGAQVDRSGPLEVIRQVEGFAITRPSPSWGVARPGLAANLVGPDSLVLANVGKDAYLDITRIDLPGPCTLEQCRDQVLQDHRGFNPPGGGAVRPASGFQLHANRLLPPVDGNERAELVLEGRYAGQRLKYLIWIVRPQPGDHYFLLRGWAQGQRFARAEPEMREAMESFRVLKE